MKGTIRKGVSFEDFKNVYKVFSGAPYYEKYTEEEYKEIFDEYNRKGIIIGAYNEDECIGLIALEDGFKKEQGVDYSGRRVRYLADLAVLEKYRKLGLGFRDIRLYETTKMILEKQVDLENLENEPNTLIVREELLKLSGVGPKVADCILLFSDLKRFDVFPIDVWVRRVMNDLYIKEADETKVSKKRIETLAKEKFGDLQGLAQQYLFYWRREA